MSADASPVPAGSADPFAAGNALADDLRLALRIADAADAISLERFRSNDLDVSTKPDRSFVTDADLAVERRIREILTEERPQDGILGEEYGTAGSTARQWIIDPIDGTANYLRGVPIWGTLISLAIDGVPVVGVVSSPALEKRWWAADGSGAWSSLRSGEPEQLRVSRVEKLADASVSFQSVTQWDDAGYLDQLVALTRASWRDRAYGDMWAYMLLAEGLVDAVGEFDVKEYDVAALVPIVREAGGATSAIDGTDRIDRRSFLATNGLLHEEILALLHG
jgi:histidinol-phosphatase